MSLPAFVLTGPLAVGLPVPLRLVECAVRAGFPSPAEDLGAKRIDLNDILITHPQATYLFRVVGDSMKDAGIYDQSLAVVNRARKATHGSIVLAQLETEFTVKYLHSRNGQVRLKAANPTYPDIVPKDGETMTVWGVVTSSINIFVK